MKRKISYGLIAILVASSLSTAGCARMGPRMVIQDRINYTTAISDSWKKQMLLNMVMIRYGDAPVFLDVSSIISQSSMETSFEAGLAWSSPLSGDSQSIGGATKYSNRPTITYSPLAGKKFAQTLMMPIPAISVLSLIDSGYPVEYVFRLFLNSINGVQNRHGGFSREHAADPEFYILVEKLGRIQQENAVGMRIQTTVDESIMLFLFRATDDEEILKDIQDVREILGLNPNVQEFKVLFGSNPRDDLEIAILSRSLLEMLADMSSSIDVPEIHIAEKRVRPTFREENIAGKSVKPLIQIHSSQKEPSDAFVSVAYRGYFFWIDDKDFPSKKLFSFLMFVSTLTETGEDSRAPIVTIPTG